jgi:acyl carrier protein
MELTVAQVVEIVDRFVVQANGVPPGTVGPSTRVLQEGLLDSFSLVSLIAELEKALGTDLPEGTLLPEDFETPQVLCDRLSQL